VRVLRSDDGDGIWVLAALWLAVLASLLPSGTIHEGPPSYKLIEILLIFENKKIMTRNYDESKLK
jgi:hypothetical protein